MRLGVISDLHVDLQEDSYQQSLIKLLAKECRKQGLTILIIAGDVANHYSLVYAFIEQLQKAIKIPLYFIPGNHDYWSDKENTWTIYDNYCKHPKCLMTKPLSLTKNWGLVGHSAWYNHAGNFGRHSEIFLEKGIYQGYKWSDKEKINWQISDRQVSKRFVKTIEKDLINLRKENYILITHFVTDFQLQILPDPNYQVDIDYFNAFISTDDLAYLYRKYPIRYSFMGHVHRRQTINISGRKYFQTSLGTPQEWEKDSVLSENIYQALKVIEIKE
ncbi:metallophosphoesterase [Facklamia miroungae]|uniref:Putative phosphoesterase n=1 Tax=Facklamia miroungae TaxID=120956 RepID=A0A1G7R0N0_9LACT|nr:metallophosphoesterase [Facklamia miroungae]NKZ29133.1 phosphohydrolase [Facklamia miroungae]SDG04234.1 putative phosphoesterase [Facklamia miroungae]